MASPISFAPLPNEIRLLLESQFWLLDMEAEDILIWREGHNGENTVKDGYKWLLATEVELLQLVNWDWIWREQVPEKVRVFSWQACRDALPVAEVLHHRGINLPLICKLCGNHVETNLYGLRDCMQVRRVWETIGLDDAACLAATSFVSWLETIPRSRAAEFMIHVWFFWRRWCRMVFDQVLESWQSVLYSAGSVMQVMGRGTSTMVEDRWVAW